MRGRAEYAEYLAEVQEQVCGHCPERPADPFSFQRACRRCGVKLQLLRLVESIHAAGEEIDEFRPALDRQTMCAQCTCLGSDCCPCPGGRMPARLVWAIRSVDERHAQRDLVRRRLSLPAQPGRVPVGEMIRAYEEATGTCVGCD
jgi:hypothetical protein